MGNILETMLPEEQKKEIKEMASIMMVLSVEDRAILLANANALKVRSDIEKAKSKALEKAAG